MTQVELLTSEIHRLMDCLDSIREMAETRKSIIRINGNQLGNYCRGALFEARHALAQANAQPHPILK